MKAHRSAPFDIAMLEFTRGSHKRSIYAQTDSDHITARELEYERLKKQFEYAIVLTDLKGGTCDVD